MSVLDAGALRSLTQLKKIAQKAGDNGLLGYVYYTNAEYYYSLELNYEKFRSYMKKAVYHFMRSDETEALARTYNFIGIDAFNMGSLDVAFNYYNTALQIAEGVENSVVTGVATGNIAEVYYRLGEYKMARRMLRESARCHRRNKADVYASRNNIEALYMEGFICLKLGQLEEANKLDRQIARYEDKTERMPNDIAVSIFRAMLYAMDKKPAKAKKTKAEVMDILRERRRLYDYIEILGEYCEFLLDRGEIDFVREILELMGDDIEETGVVYLMEAFTRLRLSYYQKIGDKDMITRVLLRRYDIANRQRSIQQQLFRYSLELSRMEADLRKKQRQMQEENRALRQLAQTDALTGISNRYAFTQLLESMLEKTKAEKTTLGLAILDIDYFKEYNDTYGHPAGDKVLEAIATALLRVTKERGCACARYGGDEFVVIFEGWDKARIREAAEYFNREIAALDLHIKAGGQNETLSVSQGVCFGVPKRGTKPWDYLAEADAALYRAKRNRKKNGKPAVSIRELPSSGKKRIKKKA